MTIGKKYARVKPKHKPLPKQVRAMPESFYAAGHTHGCERCHVRIINCRCGTPDRDPLCATCKFGRRLPWTPQESLPKDCCRDHSKVLDRKFKTERLLAGKRTWYGCEICWRIHPFDPSDPSNDPPVTLGQWRERFGELPIYHWPHTRGV